MHKLTFLGMRIKRALLPLAWSLAAPIALAQSPLSADMDDALKRAASGQPTVSARDHNARDNRIPLGQPGSMAERVAACTMCHGATDIEGADAFYPTISGKPAEYLYQQLLRFREGSREYLPMQRLVANLSDAYLLDIARWFSEQTPLYAPRPTVNVSPSILEQGERLVRQGAPERQIPACVACHGANLKGMKPAIAGLTGLSSEYITAQMGAWQYGIRHSVERDCMGDIARQMTSAEVHAVAAWLASQDPNAAGQINEPVKLPMECGIQTASGAQS